MGIGCFKQVSAAEKTEVAGNVNNVASWTNWFCWNNVPEVTSNFAGEEVLRITPWGAGLASEARYTIRDIRIRDT